MIHIDIATPMKVMMKVEFETMSDNEFNTISETDSHRRKRNRKGRHLHRRALDRKLEGSTTEKAILLDEQSYEPDANLLYSTVTDDRNLKWNYDDTNTRKESLNEADNCTGQQIPETVFRIHQDQLGRYQKADPEKIRPFECEDCGKRFKHRHHLQYHSRQHSGDKPFVCDICLKSFSQLSNMYTHRRRHSLELRCEACGKTSTNPDKLKYHLCDLTQTDKVKDE